MTYLLNNQGIGKRGGTHALKFSILKWILWPKQITAHPVHFQFRGYKTCFLTLLYRGKNRWKLLGLMNALGNRWWAWRIWALSMWKALDFFFFSVFNLFCVYAMITLFIPSYSFIINLLTSWGWAVLSSGQAFTCLALIKFSSYLK